MKGVLLFSLDQQRNNIEQLKCMHSSAAEGLLDDCDDMWLITAPADEDQTHKIVVNEDISVQSLIDEPSERSQIDKGNVPPIPEDFWNEYRYYYWYLQVSVLVLVSLLV